MRTIVGQAALVVGFLSALLCTGRWVKVARAGGAATGADSVAHRQARGLTATMFAAAVVAAGALEWALLSHDFSVRYVAENGNRAVPLYYTVISLWAGLQGSLLLWLLVLTALAAIVARAATLEDPLHSWALAVIALVTSFFFGLALFAGNAFERVSPVPANGPGPNPLLQDHPLMGVHPPLLYLGYVGLTVPFAYAVAALITGRTGAAWVAVTRRWTLVAWTALTVAVLMGGWWSYEVLGWGGYWAWDPVENASIVPWFLATALLHSMMVQSRRATLRVWNLVLAMAAFLAVLVGTFLTRSNVLQSVHSFTRSAIGPVLLGGIVVAFLGCAALLVWRADRLGPDEGLGGVLSREAVFLGNNLLLVGLALTVLIGTTFPLLAEAVNGSRISVGAPYFNRMAVPLALAVVLLMGVGPLVPWASARPGRVLSRLRWPAVAGLTTAGALGLAGLRGLSALATFGLAAFVLATIAARVGRDVASARAAGRSGMRELARRRQAYGGLVVHAGVVLAAVAIAASSSYGTSGQRKLAIGDRVMVGSYSARLVSLERHRDARRMWVSAALDLDRNGRPLGRYAPALSFYPNNTQAIGTPSVRTGVGRDAYLVLVQADEAGRWAVVSLSVNPLVAWLWASAGVMAAGAALAGWPARRRRVVRLPAAPGPPSVGPAASAAATADERATADA